MLQYFGSVHGICVRTGSPLIQEAIENGSSMNPDPCCSNFSTLAKF